MTQPYTQVSSQLIDLESELHCLSLWEDRPPSAAALLSTQPFCIDTLNFAQWLQFVFLPRMHDLIVRQQTLPAACGVAPMAEEYFRHHSLSGVKVIKILYDIDELLDQTAQKTK